MLLAMLISVPAAPGYAVRAPTSVNLGAPWSQTRTLSIVAAAKKKPQKKANSLDFAGTGSTDKSGYRRGSFGIGENESIVIWGVVAAALVFGGALDDETAKKIGAAQRSFYPSPPGLDEVSARKGKSVSVVESYPVGFPS